MNAGGGAAERTLLNVLPISKPTEPTSFSCELAIFLISPSLKVSKVAIGCYWGGLNAAK